MSESPELVVTVEELKKATLRLSDATKQVFRLAKARAETEREYRQALSKEIVIQRSKGVQATLIPDLCRGKVADLKFERDLAQEVHRSAMSSISALEVEIQSWQSILRYMNET